MRIAVVGHDLVLKIDIFFSIKKDEDKIRGSVKVIVQSAKISCTSFHDLLLTKKKFLCF